MVALGTSVQSAIDPWAIQSRIGLTDARLAMDTMLMPVPNLSYIDYRSGVMASGDTEGVDGSGHMAMKVKPATTGLAVTVEVGNCVINTPGQGAYMCALDSLTTLDLEPSSATANRIDLVIARVHDDLNPAIASASGVRKFTIEVWTGDGSTGTATQPQPSPAEGWIPLASVAVNKGVDTVTTADIKDLRGPGLVARGGMRGLYGTDTELDSTAFQEPGAYPGDQRWVHSNGFQHQVYYGGGSSRGGWRGVHNCLLYSAYPPAGDTVWTKGWGATRELARVTIPYPGTPFMVYASARAFVVISPKTSVDFRIRASAAGWVNWMREPNWDDIDRRHVPNVAPIMFGPFTDTVDIYLDASVRDAKSSSHGFAYRGNDTGQTRLSVLVYPSTVQPFG